MHRVSGLLVAASCICGLGLSPRSSAREAEPRARLAGQWLWTARDRDLFRRASKAHPELRAGVFVGTVVCAGGKLEYRRGLSPLSAGPMPQALVLRLDDSVHGCAAQLSDAEMARTLNDVLAQLLSEVAQTGARFNELQLDYDAPASKLARYARWLRYLKAHALSGTELWVTSLPAHVEQAGYGDLLRGVVAGHVLQLFDTGLRCNDDRAERLHAALLREALPYRLGYGAFERQGAPAEQAHACWQGLTRAWRSEPASAGFWVFPAGIGYERSLAALEEAP